jgi:hypothetical protein
MLFKLRAHAALSVIVAIAFFNSGCTGGNKSGSNEVAVDTSGLEQNIFEDISHAKQIFYSLPSPLESALIIKTAGATYSEPLLNPLSNVSKYTTNKAMAINLGIYITDLSYASLFDQAQTTMKYMEVSKKMADGLGIIDAINKETMDRLEENINNRDVILDIISETFMSSTAFLAENDRQPLATISLIGGWVEGLYLATQLVGDKDIKNNKIVDRIVDQKLSLDMVVKLIANNKDNSDIKEITPQIEKLKGVYDKIKISTTKIEPVVDEKTNVTTLKSSSTSNISQPIFNELRESVKNIRTSFTL